MTDWLPTLYSAAGGNVKDLGYLDGIDQWSALKFQGPSKRTEMLYNSNPMGTQSPTGSAIRYNIAKSNVRTEVLLNFLFDRFGDMKLILGEPGPGLIVQPGEYPDDSLSNNTDSVSLIMLSYKSDLSEFVIGCFR